MSRNRMTVLGLAFALVVLIADQASKHWVLSTFELRNVGRIVVLPFLSFTYVGNTGVTFGLLTGFGGGAWVLAAVSLAVVVALGVWLRRAERPLVAAALGAVVGGAIGNVVDRLRLGSVVDFLDFHVAGWSWYVFNVADAAIVCGVVALLLDSVLPRRVAAQRGRLAGASKPR